MKIDDLDLSVRSYNCLKRAGIRTVAQLRKMSDSDLEGVRNLSGKCIAEIREKLADVKTVTEVIEEVKEDICGMYCKYPGLVSPEVWDEIFPDVCGNCPLDRL